MKIVNASYEILTDISPYATCELEQIERIARTCYKSEDKIKDQGESAKELIARLIKNGHEAMLEHSQLSVKFICDRGVSHELVRHRMASFAQESTRYCNYTGDKFGKELTVIEPIVFKKMESELKDKILELAKDDQIYGELDELGTAYSYWLLSCIYAETMYMNMIRCCGVSPQIARSVLPNSLKTEIVVTANYREWRHILDLRCDKAAHPQMRELMLPLLNELHDRIPVIFDDLYDKLVTQEITDVLNRWLET